MAIPLLVRRDIFHPILVAVKHQSQASPWRARLAWLLLGLIVFLAVAQLPLWPAYHGWLIAHYDLPYSAGVSMLFAALDTFSLVSVALLGALLILAQPENRIGWLLSNAVLIGGLLNLCEKYAVYTYVIAPERALPLRELALWIQHWVWILALALMFIAFPLLFPNGRLLSRRWRWFVVWAVGLTGLLAFLVAFYPDMEITNVFLDIQNDPPNPYGIAALPRFLALLIMPLWFLVLLTSLVAGFSLVVRYRRTDSTMRQQIKWLVFYLVVSIGFSTVTALLHGVLSPDVLRLTDAVNALFSKSFPIFLGISIFKYRLYDIDLIINRTLVYGLLTATIVGLYVLIVGLLGSVFQTRNEPTVSLIATGLVAVSFQSLRERLQRGVNRLMFGQRDEPYRILSRLGQQLNTVTAPENLLATLAETVSAALKLPYAAITIRQGDEDVLWAVHGEAKTPTHVVPLVYQNERVGQLVVGQRSPGEPLTPADLRVLEDIARQMGSVVHAVRLTSDLQRSRERLVTAREEERRRLRRDLHDGLGPALASHTLKLDAAIDLVETAPREAIKLLNQMKTQSQTLVADVRRLVYDLRPPALDELGLLATIHSHIPQLVADQRTLAITVEAPSELPKLSAAVEVAAYRIAQEAVLNVIKHAEARCCTLRLSILLGRLQIEVMDDGVGLPQPLTSGVGLQSIRERAEELGGQFIAKNRSSGGVQIWVQLPLTPMEVRS